MWLSLQTRFHTIESSVIQGNFVEKLDALNLSLIDVNSNNSNASATIPELSGFKKISQSFYGLLTEAAMHQQSELTRLSVQVSDCVDFVRKHSAQLRHFAYSSTYRVEEETQTLIQLDDLLDISDWDQLPAANDEVSGPAAAVSTVDKRRKINLATRQVLGRIQTLYDKLQQIYDTKTSAQESIVNSVEAYIKALEYLAHIEGISNASFRINEATRSGYDSLLSHKFLDTTDVASQLSRVKGIWGELHFKGKSDLNERRLISRYGSREFLHMAWIDYFKFGCGLSLFLWSFSECFNNEQMGRHIWNDPTFAIFMCFGDLLLLLWMWGVSIKVWRMAGIDFVQLLGLQGTEVEAVYEPEKMVFQSSVDLTLVFFIVFIAFNKAVRGVFNNPGSLLLAHGLSVAMVVFFIYRLINPIEKRIKWFKMLYEVICAPFFPVFFRDGYIGDILTSLVRVLLSMCFSVAYLLMTAVAWLSRDSNAASSESDTWWVQSPLYRRVLVPVITLMPLWIRLMQCLRRSVESGKRWPHFGNALKYTSALGVIVFGLFNPSLRSNYLWIACFVFATIYQFIWDLTLDWGIIVSSSSNYADQSMTFAGLALRKPRLLGPTWIYTSIIIGNLVLRFAWTLTLLQVDSSEHPSVVTSILYHLGPIIAALEICRRMVWGFLRLEYEQLEVLGNPENIHALLDKVDVLDSDLESSGESSPFLKSSQTSNSWLTSVTSWDWTPFAAGLVGNLRETSFFGINAQSGPAHKARFVESIIFTTVVLIIIASAILRSHEVI